MPCIFCGGKKVGSRKVEEYGVWHQWFFWTVCSLLTSAICVTRQNAEKYGQKQQDAVLAIQKSILPW